MAEKTDAEKAAEIEARRTKALENLNTAFADLKSRIDKKDAAPPAPKPKVYTRAELRKAVNDGTITEDQMDEMLERQLRESIRAETETKIATTNEAVSRNARISAQIDSYVDAHPELKDKTSEKFQKVADKYNELVTQRGLSKDDLATELTAIELALGRAGPPRRRERQLEATEETGGGGAGDDGRPEGADEAWAKGLNKNQKQHYEKLIAKGFYSGPDDKNLKKELDAHRARRMN